MLLDTFFSLTAFEPPVMLSPSTISFVFEMFERNVRSVDLGVRVIQVCVPIFVFILSLCDISRPLTLNPSLI